LVEIIINADDFGLNDSCTNAICQAFEQELITDTTMVANGDSFEVAVEDIEKYRLKDKVGIHFNLTAGKPLTAAITQCPAFVSDGKFHGNINRLKPLSKAEKKAVYDEFIAQIKRLEAAGIQVTHADSHHHIHTCIFIAPIFAKVCKEHGIRKVRLHRNVGTIPVYKKLIKALYNTWLRNNGFTTTEFFGSMEDVEKVGVCDNLEIMVHPEFDKNDVLVDKADEVDGRAVGKKLVCPAGDYHLRGYKDL
jgi:hypothetical protein